MRDGLAIARALGGRRIRGGFSFRCPLHSDKHPSAAIRERDSLITCFAGCDRRALGAALDQLGFPDDGADADPMSPEELQQSEQEAAEYAQLFWSASRIATLDHEYLTEWLTKRGIRLPIPDHCVRVVAATRPYFYGRIAKCQRLDGTVCAVHLRDYRTKNKGFIHGVMSGQGAAVQLAAPINHELGVGEGVETCLAAQQLFGISTWASLGSVWLPYVAIPPGVRTVHLFIDNDPAGLKAMKIATRRYTQQGFDVRQWVPPKEGQDWNDFLKELANAKT